MNGYEINVISRETAVTAIIRTILLVEDDSAVRYVTRKALNRAGYIVKESEGPGGGAPLLHKVRGQN